MAGDDERGPLMEKTLTKEEECTFKLYRDLVKKEAIDQLIGVALTMMDDRKSLVEFTHYMMNKREELQ